MVWHLLPMISAPMDFQMAFDERLYELHKKDPVAGPIIRFYTSPQPWITAGCSFRNAEDLEQSGIVRKFPEIPVVRRVSGGGCVFHGNDLVFSLIARYETEGTAYLRKVRPSYQKIHEVVKMAFAVFGVTPRFYEEYEALPKGPDCFMYPVPKDLCWNGKKIAGGAQKRSGGVLLHHESVAISKVNARDLSEAICRGFEEVFGIVIEQADLDAELYFEIAKRQTSEVLVGG